MLRFSSKNKEIEIEKCNCEDEICIFEGFFLYFSSKNKHGLDMLSFSHEQNVSKHEMYSVNASVYTEALGSCHCDFVFEA